MVVLISLFSFEGVEDNGAADSKSLEHGNRMIYAGTPSVLGLGLEDGHVPTLWPLQYVASPQVSKDVAHFLFQSCRTNRVDKQSSASRAANSS